MQHYKYLIVGGGMTADSAVRGIRELDGTGSIGLISADTVGPYDRPPELLSNVVDRSVMIRRLPWVDGQLTE